MLERWHYLYLATTIMVIYVNYIILRLKLGDYENVHLPLIKSNHKGYHPPILQCCNALLCALEGQWHDRPNIQAEDFYNISNINMDLRVKKGWPNTLYHGDLRCGARFPLPRAVRTINHTKVKVLDIQSQCQPFSAHPCCREDIGWCGDGDKFCRCKMCSNYNKLRYAELSSWIPKNDCQIKQVNGDDACSYLQDAFTSISFLGDSLVRHLFSALLMHLTQDRVYGALKTNQSRAVLEFCKAEGQFVDSSCHVRLATQWSDIRENKKYCSSTERKIRLSFTQAFSTRQTELALSVMKGELVEPRPLFLVGIGIHEQFNVTKVIDDYLKPILNLRDISNDSRPEIIWLNSHAAGPLKPLVYQARQGNQNILSFNRQLRDFCMRNDILVFDTFNITADVHSFDGTHYGSEVNLLKVSMLIDSLMKISKFGRSIENPQNLNFNSV